MPELARLSIPGATIVLREARADDVPAIVRLLAADRLGATREDASAERLAPYLEAFREIDADPAHLLVVAEDGVAIVGTLQLSFLPGLARRGSRRGQIEAVRIHADRRGRRLGQAMMEWAIDESRRRGCSLVQLTSDKGRPEAHRFYEGLGFVSSHEGFKLTLP